MNDLQEYARLVRWTGFRRALSALFLLTAHALTLPAYATTYEDFNRAVAMNDGRTVAELLRRGMDPQTVNDRGEMALFTAAREGSLEVVKALLNAQAKVNARNEHGDSAIMVAALNGHLPVVKALRDAGAVINQPGWTPLLYAVINGHEAVIDYLLSSGADVASTAPNGTTAIMLATREHKFETVKLLLDYGFDFTARNAKGETALMWARRDGFKDIESLLRAAGARE